MPIGKKCYIINENEFLGRNEMNKKWEVCDCNQDLVQKVAQENHLSELIATILVNREVTEKKDVEIFLNPTRNDFHDPYLMPDMKQAIDRIEIAIQKNEKMMIYGDYDVDGVTSITVLKKFLADRGMTNVGYYIPKRLDEGYGLNREAVKKIADEGYQLIVTVDCGITGMEEIKYAYELGMEVIVTDHHEPLDEIPKAIAVIDCKRKDSHYPFKGLAGVGVVFKLIQAISQRLGLEEKEHLKYLDIVCVGTISDIVPLVDENRVISKLGLKLMAQTRCLGLKSLLEVNVGKNNVINANTVSFGIAPRINACGRIGFEQEAVKLFMTENVVEAKSMTEKLNQYNKTRQEIEKNIFEEAKEMIEKNQMQNHHTIVIGKEGWHHGVIGIVASKIMEIYFKPTILIGFENGIGKGSGRSVAGFDLHEALHTLGGYLEKYGGHEMAVGVTLKEENFAEFASKLEERAKQAHTEQIVPIISIDKEIMAKELTIETAEKLLELEPYGTSNKVPIFLIKNLKIDSIRTLVEGKHLKLTLQDGTNLINAIGFNLGNYADEFLLGDKVDIVGTIEINVFNNSKNIQINMKDMRKSY